MNGKTVVIIPKALWLALDANSPKGAFVDSPRRHSHMAVGVTRNVWRYGKEVI